MIFWIILFVALIILGIINITNEEIELGILIIVPSLFTLLYVVGVSAFDIPREINQFTQQQAYMETHIPKNELEDAALTQKKVELNSWLYDAQFKKERYGILSLYPKSVLDLEQIN